MWALDILSVNKPGSRMLLCTDMRSSDPSWDHIVVRLALGSFWYMPMLGIVWLSQQFLHEEGIDVIGCYVHSADKKLIKHIWDMLWKKQ